MRILVTGASGFIGQHVVSELAAAGHQVTALSRHARRPAGTPPNGDVQQLQADVLSDDARRAAGEAEATVHLAGRGDVQASFQEPFEYNRLNALGTLNVLEGARAGGRHVVLASTQRIYDRCDDGPIDESSPLRPTDPYAVSKLVAEQWCRMYADQLSVPTTVVRLFSVYGPGQIGQGTSGVVSIFLARARAGEPLVVHAEQARDLTWVGDVARGIRLAIETPPRAACPGRVYNLATGIGTTLYDLAQQVCAAVGSRSEIVPPTAPSPEGDRVARVDRAQHELGYTPQVTVAEGIRRLAEEASRA